MSTASRDVMGQGRGARRGPRPITLVIIAAITALVIGAMVLAWPAFGLWPLGQSNGQTVEVTPTSPYAKGILIEKVGTPKTAQIVEQLSPSRVVTVTVVTVTLKITNKVEQPSPLRGTPTPDAPTPAPEPAKVLNATIKVLFFDKAGKLVGSGAGNYFNDKGGLAPNDSATIDIVSTDVGDFATYEAYPDTVLTDKDPVKTPEAARGG